jgi:hypothetical protein
MELERKVFIEIFLRDSDQAHGCGTFCRCIPVPILQKAALAKSIPVSECRNKMAIICQYINLTAINKEHLITVVARTIDIIASLVVFVT